MSDRRAGAWKLALGLGVLALTALPTRRKHPPPLEIATFKAINRLPDVIHGPVWVVMQLGAFGTVPVAAGAAGLLRDRPLAVRLLISGSTTWVVAKVIKRAVGRGRPATVVSDIHIRGQAATGEGYLSGHAGIATALALGAATALPDLKPLLVGLAASVAVARVYVGAHLPLDVLGGAALGLTVHSVLDDVAAKRRR